MVATVKLFLERKLSFKQLKEEYKKAVQQEIAAEQQRRRDVFEQIFDEAAQCEQTIVVTESRKYKLTRLPNGALHVEITE